MGTGQRDKYVKVEVDKQTSRVKSFCKGNIITYLINMGARGSVGRGTML
jgi:hypothetical protein